MRKTLSEDALKECQLLDISRLVGPVRQSTVRSTARRRCAFRQPDVPGLARPTTCNKLVLFMKIHEYQAKAVLAKYGVPVPRGEVAFTPEEVHDIAKRLGGPISVVKAQIHAGGRGKAGGVKLAKSARRSRGDRARAARQDAGHLSDRSRRPEGLAPAGRGRPRHRPRAVSRPRPRPLHASASS